MRDDVIYRIIAQRGLEPDTMFVLDSVLLSLGREPDNDIWINDVEISRKHARFMWRDEGFSIEDVGSINGTFVNSERLTGESYLLTSGDLIAFGESVEFVYEEEIIAQPIE